MQNDLYVYPGILTYNDNEISIEFPDIDGCFTSAHSDEEILKKAQETLALNMYEIEKNITEIPKVSKIKEIKLKENQCVLMVTAYMPLYRKAIKNKAVKKTLTIPQWLNEVAEENNINFSLTLQSAIKEKLGLEEKNRRWIKSVVSNK